MSSSVGAGPQPESNHVPGIGSYMHAFTEFLVG
jgi:hypothetical protein